MVWVTYQSGPRRSDLRTVLLEGSKPKYKAALMGDDSKVQLAMLTGTLSEGQTSALPWWNVKVHGRAADDRSFECPVELIRKVRMALEGR